MKGRGPHTSHGSRSDRFRGSLFGCRGWRRAVALHHAFDAGDALGQPAQFVLYLVNLAFHAAEALLHTEPHDAETGDERRHENSCERQGEAPHILHANCSGPGRTRLSAGQAFSAAVQDCGIDRPNYPGVTVHLAKYGRRLLNGESEAS